MKNHLNHNEKIRLENMKVSKFIKSWQLKNEILNFNSLERYNDKFKYDFNKFLNSNDFSEETIKTFKI